MLKEVPKFLITLVAKAADLPSAFLSLLLGDKMLLLNPLLQVH